MTPHRLIGMVHLGPLPGAPGYQGDVRSIVRSAVADATTLSDAGFDAVLIENYGDAPFFIDDVPKITVAAMTSAVEAVGAIGLPFGVNVLRNDALAALAIAATTGATFIRVNVLSGTMFTDQGPVAGRAGEVIRFRDTHCPAVAVLADVFVKHATPPQGLSLRDAAIDLSDRSGADALVVSGPATGEPTDIGDLTTVADVTSLPVYVGSGANARSVAEILKIADGVIVRTATKPGGRIEAPVDRELATEIVRAAG